MPTPIPASAPSPDGPIRLDGRDGLDEEPLAVAAASHGLVPAEAPEKEPAWRQALQIPVHRSEGRVSQERLGLELVVPELERRFSLGRWWRWRPIPSGKSNESWFITTEKGEMVLRRSHPLKTADSLDFEIGLLEHLVARGFPAPTVVHPADGAGHVELEGRLYLLTRLLPGGQYDAANPEHLLEAGRGLGRYHRSVEDLPLTGVPETAPSLAILGEKGRARIEAVTPLLWRELAGDERRAGLQAMGAVLEEMWLLEQELAGARGLTRLLLHGSYGRTALLLDGDRLSGVVDFDRAVHDLLGLDLAYALKGFARVGENGGYQVAIDLEATRRFLGAYAEVRPLAPEELDVLPLLFRAQRLLMLVKKCDNVVAKEAVTPRTARDLAKLASLFSRELARVRWLDDHASALVAT